MKTLPLGLFPVGFMQPIQPKAENADWNSNTIGCMKKKSFVQPDIFGEFCGNFAAVFWLLFPAMGYFFPNLFFSILVPTTRATKIAPIAMR